MSTIDGFTATSNSEPPRRMNRRQFIAGVVGGAGFLTLTKLIGDDAFADAATKPQPVRLDHKTVLVRNPAYVARAATEGGVVLETGSPGGRRVAWQLDAAGAAVWKHTVTREAYQSGHNIPIAHLLELLQARFPKRPATEIHREALSFITKAVQNGIFLVPPIQNARVERRSL